MLYMITGRYWNTANSVLVVCHFGKTWFVVKAAEIKDRVRFYQIEKLHVSRRPYACDTLLRCIDPLSKSMQ